MEKKRRGLDPYTVVGLSIRNCRKLFHPGPGGRAACARGVGVSPEQWKEWEEGTSFPLPPQAGALADFFAVPRSLLSPVSVPCPADVPGAVSIGLDRFTAGRGGTGCVDAGPAADREVLLLAARWAEAGKELFGHLFSRGCAVQACISFPLQEEDAADGLRQAVSRAVGRLKEAERFAVQREPGSGKVSVAWKAASHAAPGADR